MDAQQLYELLPAIYRLRDAEGGEPLRALVEVLAGQVAVVEENLAELYDDLFVETAADWAVPYIGDLIGYRELYGVTPRIASPRAEVANTIGFRRRKGTASMLEQLARDVTGWDARVVEQFQLLATTQYLNHVRPENRATPDLRQWQPLAVLGTPFDTLSHTVDVRRISRGRGRFNIPDVGIFLWRIPAYGHTRSPAVPLDARRFRFGPLGADLALYNVPSPEETVTHLATPANVAQPLTRRRLREELAQHYGPGLALYVERGSVDVQGRLDPGQPIVAVPPADLLVCNLADVAGGGGAWAHTPVPAGRVAIDPLAGRIASGDDEAGVLLVSYHYGFSADLGGGEYERSDTFDEGLLPVRRVAMGAALQPVVAGGPGAVEIMDSGRYEENLSFALPGGARLEVRAANGTRPTLALGAELAISGDAEGEVTLNGLLVTGGTLRVSGPLRRLRLVHCTLVPGLALGGDGTPLSPDAPSLVLEAAGTALELDHCIVGPLRVHGDATVSVQNSIVDALSDEAVAYAGPDGASPGAPIELRNSTIVGRLWARVMPEASNVVFLASLPDPDPEPPGPGRWAYPVRVEERQTGCVRFSYVPPGSHVPRRHRCQPDSADASLDETIDVTVDQAARVRPVFTSLRYGTAGYLQLSRRCAPEITAGSEDGSEMGAFHDLFGAQRETNLRIRLDEYLRFGLEAGIFYAS